VPPRWTRILSLLALIAGVGALGLLAQRVYAHERGELDFASEPRALAELARSPGSTAVSARIARVPLEAGELAVFELCVHDALEPARWLDAFELVVFQLPEMKLMLRVPLDEKRLRAARRNAAGACLNLGAYNIERSGAYALDAVWLRAKPAAPLLQVPLRARVLATRGLGPQEKAAWLLLGLSVLTLLAAQLASRPRPSPRSDPSADGSDMGPAQMGTILPNQCLRTTRLRTTIAALTLLAAVIALTQVPSTGALATLAKGLALVALQCAVPLLLARLWRSDRDFLPIAARFRPALAFAIAGGAATLLWVLAGLALRLVPATGEAPIQTFVNWPSGLLCFAALGVLLPLGEELLFRGVLYRALLAWTGRAGWAAVLCWLPFVALHAQQSWGNWGGLVSIAMAGAVLTALRVASRSVLVPALAHVLYNFALSARAFW
jgi:membrane protease YdiL (CAAX protease family)